jgi:hypothetical protein
MAFAEPLGSLVRITAPRSMMAVLNNRPSSASIVPMTIIGPVSGNRFTASNAGGARSSACRRASDRQLAAAARSGRGRIGCDLPEYGGNAIDHGAVWAGGMFTDLVVLDPKGSQITEYLQPRSTNIRRV